MRITLSKIRMLNKKGVTLPEVLVVVVLFAILSGVSFTLLLSGSSSFEYNKARAELQQEMRKSVDWLKEDFRQTGSAGITTPASGATGTSITFQQATGANSGTIIWSGNVSYARGGTGGNQLLRTVGGVTRAIAQNITSITFDRTNAKLMTVTLVASKNAIKGGTMTLNYSFKVMERN
jgi:prepilin-type N-terminal cleavage/methylation domain-containing protein